MLIDVLVEKPSSNKQLWYAHSTEPKKIPTNRSLL